MSFKHTGPKVRPEREKPVQPTPVVSHSRRSSTASSTSFTSAVEDQHDDETERSQSLRFSPEEETKLLEKSHEIKSEANLQFVCKDYTSALSTYDKALAECPNYLEYELAVLQSNIAACHIQLKEWKNAIDAAERGLESLERELPTLKAKPKEKNQSNKSDATESDLKQQADQKVVELPDDNDDEANAELLRQLNISDERKADIHRIRTKLLLRRARAKVMLAQPHNEADSLVGEEDSSATTEGHNLKSPTGSSWGNLSAALDDYTTLAKPEYFKKLPTSDQKTVLEALRTLPEKVEVAKKKEVDEMMGKLKELGNGILKPFGLSTDMFKMTQDPNTGGWSMNFDGKASK